MLRNNLRASAVCDIYHLEGSLDTLGVSIDTEQGHLFLVFLYKHPEFYICTEHWNSFFASTSNFNNIVIASDFNSHGISWGCAHTNSLGRSLEKAISNYNLSILNNGSSTRITPPNQRKSAVDLTLVNSVSIPGSTWQVLDDSFNSDHFLIATTLNASITPRARFHHKIDNQSTD